MGFSNLHIHVRYCQSGRYLYWSESDICCFVVRHVSVNSGVSVVIVVVLVVVVCVGGGRCVCV